MKKLLIFLAAAALVVAFTLPATAADEIRWNWYGNARVKTFWVSEDFKDSKTVGGKGSTEDTQLDWAWQGNSRIGFRVKGGAIGGRVEFRSSNEDAQGSNSTIDPGFAHLNGTWNFGSGTLIVGRDQPPIYQFYSGQIYNDTGGIGYGAAYSRRRGQLGLKFGGFHVAFLAPRTEALGTNGDEDPYIPKVEARWGMGFDTWNFNLMGGFQTYELSNVTNLNGNNKDVTVNSYMIGADAGLNLGPFYVKGGVQYGENFGNADWVGPSASFDGSSDTDDVTTLGYGLVLGFKLTDMVTFEGGAIGQSDDYDAKGRGDANKYTAYLQAVLQMHPGVFFIPEFSYFNNEDKGTGGTKGPTKWALGGKWQINF